MKEDGTMVAGEKREFSVVSFQLTVSEKKKN